MTFQSCRLNDAKILETFVARLVNVREDLEDDELNKIITTLSDLGYVNQQYIDLLVSAFMHKTVD